ncbi:uncharacterized protein LOC118431173 [Branchiostoma floridae]|uniref:Uncharacterized protein LOC118431173 n=1 Tax=Branchiostoma floridae TaxID=7739 RepID=A0A9J7MCP3_BRAFL|nr:uncharacterized protein LOC118431173 [Branchiostoma floridae]
MIVQMNFRRFLLVLAIVGGQFAPALPSQTCVAELEYRHNGRCCDLCAPGYYKVKDCTRNHQTECARCADGYYLEHPNFESGCRRCTRCSSRVRMEQKMPCLKDQNRVCQCMKGYYIPPGQVMEVCIKHMKCPPGEGVSRRGTPLSNTVCRPCAHGTFSNKRSPRQKCLQWTDCAHLGREELESGTSEQDAVCGDKLIITTTSVPPLTSTAKSTSTTTTDLKPQPLYSVFLNASTISTPTISLRSPRQQTSDFMPSSNFTMASTTVTPSKQWSTSDVFIPMSTTGSSTQPMSSPTKPITLDIKTLLTKAKTIPSPSSDKGISDSSTIPSGSTTTSANMAPAYGNTNTDQKPVTIMQPKTRYFMESIVKAIPATTPATYINTGTTEQEKESNSEHGLEVRNNGVQGLAKLQIAMIVILCCLVVITPAAVAWYACCRKKKTPLPTDLPDVYYKMYKKGNENVSIGAPLQEEDDMGAGDTPDHNGSSAVLLVEVHDEPSNQINTSAGDEHSPLISASGEHPEEASSPSEVPDIPITEVDLMKLARTIGPGWEDASIQVLGISRAELATCQANNQSNRNMQIFDMLSLWKQKLGKRATLQSLCQLLSQAEVEYRVENV